MRHWLPALVLLALAALVAATGPVLSWDPQPLEPNWWLPTPTRYDPRRGKVFAVRSKRTCAEQTEDGGTRIVQLRGLRSGRFNNKLLILKNALELVTTLEPPHRLLATPTKWPGLAEMLDIFDLVNATASWTCLLMKMPLPDPVPPQRGAKSRAVTPLNQVERIPYLLDAMLAMNVKHITPKAPGAFAPARIFYEGFMAQVLLRPAPPLRLYVERLERLLGLDKQADYVGVHFRQLEGDCLRKNTPQTMKARLIPVRLRGGRNFTREDACLLSDDFLLAYMRKLGVPRSAPLVIGYDGQAPERLAELKKAFNVIVPGELPGFASECTLPSGRATPPVIVDMLLMVSACLRERVRVARVCAVTDIASHGCYECYLLRLDARACLHRQPAVDALVQHRSRALAPARGPASKPEAQRAGAVPAARRSSIPSRPTGFNVNH
ncbi:hypothetical protein T492DRAFT_1058079 [Pavlovales sp. CCMP2436]|nr:hypothetical protein T492DRAFT_1058079 [Pavlovales sp. CCMP2436]